GYPSCVHCHTIRFTSPVFRRVNFTSIADLRSLHSFPTRRSSDLSGGRDAELGGVRHASGRDQDRIGSDRLRQLHLGEASAGFERDRKSTRLNSSHVSISYAVFCLKKKRMAKRNMMRRKRNKRQLS